MKALTMKSFTLLFAAALMASSIVRAEDKPADKPKKPWKSVTEASVVSANGNTKSSTYAGKETFNYDWTKTTLELIGAGMGSDSGGHSTAEKYMASEKLTYKVTDRNYLYEKGAWDKDRFAGIKSRLEGTAGLGRELVKNDRNLLIGELGAGYVNEMRKNERKNDFATGRAYSKYTFKVSETSNFSQDAEYLSNFEDSDDFRVNTETAITAAINTTLALKASYVWHHVGQPPAGFHRNDTLTAVALVATY